MKNYRNQKKFPFLKLETVILALKILAKNGPFEVCIIYTSQGQSKPTIKSGIFNSADKALDAIKNQNVKDTDRGGYYICYNTVKDNKPVTNLLQQKSTRVKDEDIEWRNIFPIDIDPDRPTNVNSTEEEWKLAIDKAKEISRWLHSNFGIKPKLVSSGNGAHLLLKCDLENSPEVQSLARSLLHALARRFDTDKVHIDKSVHNASRLMRLPGSKNMKGEDTQERPQRFAEIIEWPKKTKDLDQELLEKICKDVQIIDEDTGPVSAASMSAQMDDSQNNGAVSKGFARKLLNALPKHFTSDQGGYNTWFNSISSLSSVFSEREVEQLVEEWSPGYEGEVWEKIVSLRGKPKMSFGWLVNLAKEYGFDNKKAWAEEFKDPHDLLVPRAYQDEGELELSDQLIDKLPKFLRDFLAYASPLSDVPDIFLLATIFPLLGGVMGKQVYLKAGVIKIYPVFWVVLFAGSSTMRKSTSITIVKKIFSGIVEKFEADYKQELEAWKQRKKEASENEEEFNEPEPKMRRLYTSDSFSDLTFFEEFQNSGSLVSIPKEFLGLFEEINRPQAKLDEQALNIFDVVDSIRRNTKSGGDIEIHHPIWNIIGATTLDAMRRKLSQANRGSGFLQRILPICALKPTKKFKTLLNLPEEDYEASLNLGWWLFKLLKISGDDGEPRVMKVSSESQYLYNDWAVKLNDLGNEQAQEVSDIGGFISRLQAYCLKFAMVFQILEDTNSEQILLPAMEAAVAFSNFLLKHQTYMLRNNYVWDKSYSDRLKIREIISRQPDNTITRSDLMNLSNFNKWRLDTALESDFESGHIKEIEEDTGGTRPLRKYRLLKKDD